MTVFESPKIWHTLRLRGGFSYRFDRRVPFVALMLALFTFATLVFSISYGEYDISPIEVLQTMAHILPEDHEKYRQFNLVVFTFRLPRIWVAFMAGAALATSGAIMQGITRNPLADPYLLGVSGGAGLVAVSVIVLFDDVPMRYLTWLAFGGALVAAVLIYGLAWKGGTSTPMRLILIGVAMAAIVNAITTMILVSGQITQVQQAYVWLSGSVYGRTWQHVHLLAGWLVVLLPLAFLSARWLNILNMGDETAKGLGMQVEKQRGALLILSVALAAGAVAMSGTIGFVGLVAPHVTRRLVGPAHEGLLPVSALFGGALLVTADLIGRWVIAPSEIPIGIVTAMIGAPYFLYLLYRGRND